jgi:hypothetical protein
MGGFRGVACCEQRKIFSGFCLKGTQTHHSRSRFDFARSRATFERARQSIRTALLAERIRIGRRSCEIVKRCCLSAKNLLTLTGPDGKL